MDQNAFVRAELARLSRQLSDLMAFVNAGFDQQQRFLQRFENRWEELLSGKLTWTLSQIERQDPRSTSPPTSTSAPTSDPSTSTSSTRCRSRSPSPASSRRFQRTRTSGPRAEATVDLPRAHHYLLDRSLETVVEVWREWSVGIGNGPAVKDLNDTYGSGWRAGWPPKERQYYSMRLIIIDRIYYLAIHEAQGLEPRYDEAAERLDRERGDKSLNALAKQIKAAMRRRDEVKRVAGGGFS